MSAFTSKSSPIRLLLWVIALSLLLFLAGREALTRYVQWVDTSRMQSLMTDLEAGAPLVRALQDERTATGRSMAEDNAAQTRDALTRQRQNTDRVYFEGAELSGLPELRRSVDQSNRSQDEASLAYSELVTRLINQIEVAAQQSTDAVPVRKLEAYQALVTAGELASREQISGFALITGEEFSVPSIGALAALAGQQDALLGSVIRLLPAHSPLRTRIRDLNNTDEAQAMVALRSRLFSSGVVSDAPSTDEWLTISAQRIDRLRGLQTEALDRSIQILEGRVAESRAAFMQGAALFAGSLLLAVLVMIATMRRTRLRKNKLMLEGIRSALEQKAFTRPIPVPAGHPQAAELRAVNDLLAEVAETQRKLDRTQAESAASVREKPRPPEPQQAPRQTPEQVQQIEQVAEATDALSTTARDVVTTTRAVADVSAHALEKSQSGGEVVRNSVQRIQALAESVTEVNTVVEDLEQRTSGIREMLQVIRKVADQTNLLALNAAIEAARAGEHGRGFAVVADEVRTLARQTQESATQIEDIIDNLTSVTERAGRAVVESQSQADEVREQANQLEQSYADLMEDVTRISEMAAQIAASSESEVNDSQALAQRLRALI